MPVIQIDTIHPLYTQVLALRHRILRVPLGLSISKADTAGEDQQIILIYVTNGIASGCILLQWLDPDNLKMRQLAVDAELQRTGIGRQLVHHAEDFARDRQVKNIVLHARKSAVSFYLRLGYTISGEEFTEVGIPHLIMKKPLKP